LGEERARCKKKEGRRLAGVVLTREGGKQGSHGAGAGVNLVHKGGVRRKASLTERRGRKWLLSVPKIKLAGL